MLFCCFSIVGEKIHVIWFIVRKFTEQFVAYYINVMYAVSLSNTLTKILSLVFRIEL